MGEFVKFFYLPKELRIKAFWYMLCNITIMSLYFLMCFLEDRLLVRGVLSFAVVGTYFFAQIFTPEIIRNKMQDFFFYIFLANAIDIVIATIQIFLLLKDFPLWVMIFPLILLALLSGYSMMEFFFDKQMKLFKKKLFGYAWHSYYKGSLEYMWLPVNNDTLEPYCKFGDLLCLKKCQIEFQEDEIKIESLNRDKYVVVDTSEKYHYVEIEYIRKTHIMNYGWIYEKRINVRPDIALVKSNIKTMYQVIEKINDLKVYDN